MIFTLLATQRSPLNPTQWFPFGRAPHFLTSRPRLATGVQLRQGRAASQRLPIRPARPAHNAAAATQDQSAEALTSQAQRAMPHRTAMGILRVVDMRAVQALGFRQGRAARRKNPPRQPMLAVARRLHHPPTSLRQPQAAHEETTFSPKPTTIAITEVRVRRWSFRQEAQAFSSVAVWRPANSLRV